MKFELTRTSDLFEDERKTIDVNSLEDLERLQRDNGCSLIVNFTNGSIEIYDSWRE